MWLSRLDLLAFGRFSNVRLKLGPGFHLVYGPNEAGKSTTLRAIRQLLFGFDERTTDNFVHANPNLRIGGVLCGDAGIELEVIRRKTRKDSLRAADDTTVIDANEWQRLLCGIDENTFSQRYGIDYQQLVEGGREIAMGSGDLGEILFATGSGVMDLAAIQTRLKDEAAGLFLAQGKKPRINLALVEWQSQRDKVTEKLLPVSDWEETDRLRQEAEARLLEISREWKLRTDERDRLRSWQQASPLLRDQDAFEQQLVSFAAVRGLPIEFGKKRQEATILLKHASEQEQAAREAVIQSQNQIEKLAVPKILLERSDELSSLLTEWGSYSKAQLDRSGLLEQCDRHAATIVELLQALSIPVDESLIEQVALDVAQRTHLRQLGRQQSALVQAFQQAQAGRERLIERIAAVQASAAAMPIARPLEELRSAVQQIRSDGDLEVQLARIRSEIVTLQREAELLGERLGLWNGSIADLRSIRIPTPAVGEKWKTEFDANRNEQSLHRARLAELEDEHRQLTLEIEELRHQFQVPTEAELARARKNRDGIWSEIRNTALSKVVPSNTLIDSFEQSLIETDRLVDRLRNEADRVAQLAEQLDDHAANETRQHEISVKLAALEADRLEIERRWNAEWPDLGTAPLAPREMETWLIRRETLLQNDDLVRRRIVESNQLSNCINERRSLLANLLSNDSPITNFAPAHQNSVPSDVSTETVDQSLLPKSRQQLSFGWEPASRESNEIDDRTSTDLPSVPDCSLSELLSQAVAQLTRDDNLKHDRKDAEETLERLMIELSEAEVQSERATDEWAQWKIVWQDAMVKLNLSPDSSPDIADKHVETLFELRNVRKELAQLRERVAGIDADAERFKANVKTICQAIAPDLADLDIDDLVKSLRTRLLACQRDQATLNDQSIQKAHAEKQLVLALESRTRGEALVADLCRLAGLNRPEQDSVTDGPQGSLELAFEELAKFEEQAQNAKVLEQKLERVRNRLGELASDQPIVEFLDQVRRQSPEALAKSLAEIDSKVAEIEGERDLCNQQLGGINERLKKMDGSAEAAQAEEQQRQWLAQIRSDAEQYIRVKLASSVLHTSIERYREKIRGPVLSVASELFRELTLNSFAGLRVDEDDHSKPVLVGLRTGSGEAVRVSGMSEGTCDQLYLALRLASLRLESSPRNQLPFVVDDILIQFDDARAAAALSVLCKLGQQRQVIFFTHHEHLLEIADKHLSAAYTAHRL